MGRDGSSQEGLGQNGTGWDRDKRTEWGRVRWAIGRVAASYKGGSVLMISCPIYTTNG